MEKRHDLKTINPYFSDVWSGKKTFEIRNNDRGFQLNDIVVLWEYSSPPTDAEPRSIKIKITYLLANSEYLLPGFCAFSFVIISKYP